MATKKKKVTARASYALPISKITKKYGAKKVRVFGSFARGEQTKKSDVDLLVKMPKKSTLLHVVGMKQDLEKVLHKKVDIVTYKNIKPALRSRILREARKI